MIPYQLAEALKVAGVIFVSFIIGLAWGMDLSRRKAKRAFDNGWNSRGIHDWKKSMEKRDKAGRFAPRVPRE